jgi:putative flippase GtrA
VGSVFARFLLAGAAGYAVNLAVYGSAVHVAHADYRLSAMLAFCMALTTTFVLNRRFTFGFHEATVGRLAPRYVVVCLVGFAVNLLALQVFVDVAHLPKLLAQALAIALAAPVNFAGQRLWTFASSREPATG